MGKSRNTASLVLSEDSDEEQRKLAEQHEMEEWDDAEGTLPCSIRAKPCYDEGPRHSNTATAHAKKRKESPTEDSANEDRPKVRCQPKPSGKQMELEEDKIERVRRKLEKNKKENAALMKVIAAQGGTQGHCMDSFSPIAAGLTLVPLEVDDGGGAELEEETLPTEKLHFSSSIKSLNVTVIQEKTAPLKELKRKKSAAQQEPSGNTVKTTGSKLFDGTENQDDGAPGPDTISTKSASLLSQGKEIGVSKGMQNENEDASEDSLSKMNRHRA